MKDTNASQRSHPAGTEGKESAASILDPLHLEGEPDPKQQGVEAHGPTGQKGISKPHEARTDPSWGDRLMVPHPVGFPAEPGQVHLKNPEQRKGPDDIQALDALALTQGSRFKWSPGHTLPLEGWVQVPIPMK
ncbi:MAG: hypothetical protein HYZ13_16835 [Acidobacteria bacterium]|nr:hypothetical protein [Acidobacteriota bacterium]